MTLKELHGYIQERLKLPREREDECFKLRRSSAYKEEAVIYTSKDGATLHKWLMAAREALTAELKNPQFSSPTGSDVRKT